MLRLINQREFQTRQTRKQSHNVKRYMYHYASWEMFMFFISLFIFLLFVLIMSLVETIEYTGKGLVIFFSFFGEWVAVFFTLHLA